MLDRLSSVEATRERRRAIALIVIALMLVVSAPFLVISPDNVRGVPGPLLIVIALGAAFLLGPYLGVGLMVAAVFLSVAVIGENPVSQPLVWIPAAIAAGMLGDHVRADDETRRQMLVELRAGLVALTDLSEVGALGVTARYAPAESAQVLAADFYGILVTPDGELAVMVGDVAGHGPRAAAVAAHLRAGWRALVGAGVPQVEVIRVLDQMLAAEQARDREGAVAFASVCLVRVRADYRSASVLLAGHPAPILIADDGGGQLEVAPNPLIGLGLDVERTAEVIDLPEGLWTLVLFTDGLTEGRDARGRRPLGVERVVEEFARRGPAVGAADVDSVMEQVIDVNGGPLGDDVVVLAVARTTMIDLPPRVEAAARGDR